MSAVTDALAAKQAARLGIDLRDPALRVAVEIDSRSMLAECGIVIPAGRSTQHIYPEDLERLQRLVDRSTEADRAAVENELENLRASAKKGDTAPSREAAYHRVMVARAARGEVSADMPPIVSLRVIQPAAKKG